MHSDWIDLLKAFKSFGVKYLIVGGCALARYTEPRFTKDLDVWIEPTPENAAAVFRALASFGAPLAGLTGEDFAQVGVWYQLGRPPVRIDVLTSIDGVTFDEAWPNRLEADLAGVPVSFIGRKDLIRNKRAAGRHIDLHDVETLEGGSD